MTDSCFCHKETPKYRLAEGRDAEAVENLRRIAAKYNRPISLTLEMLQACGDTALADNHAKHHMTPSEILVHIRGLFKTRRLALSTSLIWLSWTLIGLAYPLFQVFLPTYLASRGAEFGQLSPDITWRNYALANICSIFGPLVAGCMAATVLGRRYTMVIGALLTSELPSHMPHRGPLRRIGTQHIDNYCVESVSFFWAYSRVTNNASNVAFTCVVNFTLYVVAHAT